MTDSALKLNEMQRSSIEYERQRHLANWFIKSGPHMPVPSSSGCSSTANTATVTANTLATAATTNTTETSGIGTYLFNFKNISGNAA